MLLCDIHQKSNKTPKLLKSTHKFGDVGRESERGQYVFIVCACVGVCTYVQGCLIPRLNTCFEK